MTTITNRQKRADAFYRLKLSEALRGVLSVANPQDQLTWPMKFEELVDYTLDILKTEQSEVSEGSPPAKSSGGGLSLDD